LTKFRDFLNRVITMGEINGKWIFSSPIVIVFFYKKIHKYPIHSIWSFAKRYLQLST
jgi:hypothetical protein